MAGQTPPPPHVSFVMQGTMRALSVTDPQHTGKHTIYLESSSS